MIGKKRINKDRTFKFRCTESELLLWRAKAKALGVPVAKLLTDALNGINTKPKMDRDMKKQQLVEVARIGNNLNQVARWVNVHKGEIDAIDVLIVLKNIEQQLHVFLYTPSNLKLGVEGNEG